MSDARFRTLLLLGVLALVAAALVATVWVSGIVHRQHHEQCAALGAHPVETGHMHFLCIDGDGRVVGP